MKKKATTQKSKKNIDRDKRSPGFRARVDFNHFLENLDRWFALQKRVLPWRDRPSYYRVWVSEIMLQQTQVITVIPYFERFMAKFPTVASLAEAPVEEVLLLWSGLGYYSRARNLHRGAKFIVEDLQGKFPRTREGWLQIPGVGNYTAGAILSIAGNQAEAILDGNVERVLSRVHRVSRDSGETAYKSELWGLSQSFVELAQEMQLHPSNINQALMELGAMVCTPRKPQCLICPLSGTCRGYQNGEQDQYPPKKKPKEWIRVQEQLQCLVNEKGQVLLRQRQEGEWRAGLWDLMELPAPTSTIPHALNGPFKGTKLGQVETRHVVTRHKIERSTHVWRIKNLPEKPGFKWVSILQPDLPMGSALKKTLQKVLLEFPGLGT